MDSFRIAALGRPVTLGALYDYDTGRILEPDSCTNQLISRARRWSDTLPRTTQTSFMIQQQDADSALFLDLNAVSERHLRDQPIDWCRPLLQDQCPKDKVQVLVRLQRLIRTDCIEVGDIVDSKQLQEGGSETGYLVRQITYGAQAVVVLQMDAVDEAERQEVQDELLLAAVSFFSQLGDLSKRSQVLDRATCRFYSDLMGRSEWISFAHCLNHCVYPFVMVQEVNWLPQNVLLYPAGKYRADQQDEDWQCDVAKSTSTLKWSIEKAMEESKPLMDDTFVDVVPHLKEHVVAFEGSLTALSTFINCVFERIANSTRVVDYYHSSNVIMATCWHYFSSAAFDRWLATKRREIRALKNLLRDVQLKVMSPEHLGEFDDLRLFLLSTFNEPDLLIEEIRRRTKTKEETGHFRVYRIGCQPDDHFIDVKSKLLRFALQAKNGGKLSVITTSDCHQDEAVVQNRPSHSNHPQRSVVFVNGRDFQADTAALVDGDRQPSRRNDTQRPSPPNTSESGPRPTDPLQNHGVHSTNDDRPATAAGPPSSIGPAVPGATVTDSRRIVFTAHRRDSQGNVVASVQGDWPSQPGGQFDDGQSQTGRNRSDLSASSARRHRSSSESTEPRRMDANTKNKDRPPHLFPNVIEYSNTLPKSTAKKNAVESIDPTRGSSAH